MADCGVGVPCPALTEAQALQKQSMTIDLIREITRNLIGFMVIPGIIFLLYKFVDMAPDEDKMNVMLLVIGYMGGLVTGISTWYFGGAMRSAIQSAIQQTKGGTPNVQENLPGPVEPGSDDPSLGVRRGDGGAAPGGEGIPREPEGHGPENLTGRQRNILGGVQDLGATGQPGEAASVGQKTGGKPRKQVRGGPQPGSPGATG